MFQSLDEGFFISNYWDALKTRVDFAGFSPLMRDFLFLTCGVETSPLRFERVSVP